MLEVFARLVAVDAVAAIAESILVSHHERLHTGLQLIRMVDRVRSAPCRDTGIGI